LRQKIALMDASREVIGLTLKKLGYSYNEAQPQKIAELLPALQALQTQVKFYSSRHSLQSLLMGDVWLVVGWSNEVLPLLKTQPDLAAVIPSSGTSLWSDIWVAPKGESLDGFLPWIENSWQPESVNQISLLTSGSSPGLESLAATAILPAVRHNPLINVPPSLLARCEFLEPLTESSEAAYAELWQKMRLS
jgi:putative spermidine/putrescine transport system substrate-binding protein